MAEGSLEAYVYVILISQSIGGSCRGLTKTVLTTMYGTVGEIPVSGI